MLYLSALILSVVILIIYLTIILSKSLTKALNNNKHIEDVYNKLLSQNAELKKENLAIEKTNEEIIALYEITKQICKTLEADQVFGYFKEQMDKYIKVKDCRFLKSEADLSMYAGYTALPLKVDKKPAGYLLASGIQKKDEDKFHILSQQFLLGIRRAVLYQKVQELAIMDNLAGVLSRRYCMERFNEDIERSIKFKYSLSFLIVDIDHFKDYNDRYGHLVGDTILKEVAKTIKESIRQIDLLGRYGGDEFCVILIETDKEGAGFAAERMRQAVEGKQIRVYDEDLKITISIGISTLPGDGRDAAALIEEADEALYRAKGLGRNRVCTA
jgi:diguanylate cyclase (GGDEF)-like protein